VNVAGLEPNTKVSTTPELSICTVQGAIPIKLRLKFAVCPEQMESSKMLKVAVGVGVTVIATGTGEGMPAQPLASLTLSTRYRYTPDAEKGPTKIVSFKAMVVVSTIIALATLSRMFTTHGAVPV
jgi:hypothetical protein